MKKPQWVTIANALGITVIRGVRRYTVDSPGGSQWAVTRHYIQLEHARKQPDGFWKRATVEVFTPAPVKKIGEAINPLWFSTQPGMITSLKISDTGSFMTKDPMVVVSGGQSPMKPLPVKSWH